MDVRRWKIIYERRSNVSCQSRNSVRVDKSIEIKPDIIQKSLKKFSISRNLDGKEDDYLWIRLRDGNHETEFDDVPENITEDQ